MSTNIAESKKTYIRVPTRTILTRRAKFMRAATGSASSPFYWLAALCRRQPGLRFGFDSAGLGLRSVLEKDASVSYAEIYRMLFWPIESTRYFEFDLAWRFIADTNLRRYLDVSSPRLFPITLLARRSEATGELINPDFEDLRVTSGLIKAAGLSHRCRVWSCLIEQAPFPAGSFDVITSISVVEHIRQDREAVRQMWELLQPGGRLVLSTPCAARAEEQYLDVDHFGVQEPEKNGFFFHQYIYDAALLQERFYDLIGPPTRFAVYGEKEPGSLLRGLLTKWSGGTYPRWKEPYLMASQFKSYASPNHLPGEGVIIMEFEKK
jgi:SAM-dependent methyltransferase